MTTIFVTRSSGWYTALIGSSPRESAPEASPDDAVAHQRARAANG
jgi:hypothetical protein